MIFPTLSLCAFLRALTCGMRWWVRCRRWRPFEPIEGACSAPFGAQHVLQAESPRHRPVQQGLHRLGLWHAHLQSEWGGLHIVRPPLESFVACPCDSDPLLDHGQKLSALALTRPPTYKNCIACLHLWPAALKTSGEARGAWLMAAVVWSSYFSRAPSDLVLRKR